MPYKIRVTSEQKVVGREPIASYRQHQVIKVGYLQQCPHFERETSPCIYMQSNKIHKVF